MGTVADKLNKLIETKETIKTSIQNKGVEVLDTDPFASYAEKIDSIQTGGGDLSEYITTEITGVSSAYSALPYAKLITKLPPLTNTGTSCQYLFYYLINLKEIDLSNFDTTNVSTFSSMFENCNSLTKIIGLDKIVTNNATNINRMFSGCNSLPDGLNVNHFNTSKVNDLTNIFYNCKLLKTLDLSNWDTSSVGTFQGTFQNCTSLETLDISNFTTNPTKSVSFNSTFYSCTNLKNVNWGNLFTNSGNAYGQTFSGCSSLEELPIINLEKAIRIDGIVNLCTSLKNVGGFKDLGKAYTQKSANYNNYSLVLNYSNDITHDSLMNVINNLYDLNLTYDVANGGTLYTQKLVLGANNIAKLTEEELAVATNKGWSVS